MPEIPITHIELFRKLSDLEVKITDRLARIETKLEENSKTASSVKSEVDNIKLKVADNYLDLSNNSAISTFVWKGLGVIASVGVLAVAIFEATKHYIGG